MVRPNVGGLRACPRKMLYFKSSEVVLDVNYLIIMYYNRNRNPYIDIYIYYLYIITERFIQRGYLFLSHRRVQSWCLLF